MAVPPKAAAATVAAVAAVEVAVATKFAVQHDEASHLAPKGTEAVEVLPCSRVFERSCQGNRPRPTAVLVEELQPTAEEGRSAATAESREIAAAAVAVPTAGGPVAAAAANEMRVALAPRRTKAGTYEEAVLLLAVNVVGLPESRAAEADAAGSLATVALAVLPGIRVAVAATADVVALPLARAVAKVAAGSRPIVVAAVAAVGSAVEVHTDLHWAAAAAAAAGSPAKIVEAVARNLAAVAALATDLAAAAAVVESRKVTIADAAVVAASLVTTSATTATEVGRLAADRQGAAPKHGSLPVAESTIPQRQSAQSLQLRRVLALQLRPADLPRTARPRAERKRPLLTPATGPRLNWHPQVAPPRSVEVADRKSSKRVVAAVAVDDPAEDRKNAAAAVAARTVDTPDILGEAALRTVANSRGMDTRSSFLPMRPAGRRRLRSTRRQR